MSGPGTHSLQLGPGATAVSSPLPVNLLDPWVRFFARSNQANGSLRVQVVFHGLLGNLTGILNVGSLSASSYSSWSPTARVPSLLALPLATTSAQVVVTSQATSGSWQVDDFYLDPCAVEARLIRREDGTDRARLSGLASSAWRRRRRHRGDRRISSKS